MFGASFEVEFCAVSRDDNGVIVKDDSKPKLVLLCRPVTLEAAATLDVWLRRRYVKAVEEAATDLGEDDRRLAVVNATREAVSLTWTNPQALPLLNCVDGMALMAFLAVRESAPHMTLEAMRSLLSYGPNYFEYVEKLNSFQAEAAKVSLESFRKALAQSILALRANRAKQQQQQS